MNWNDLQYVLAAGRRRTLLGASEALNVTHTTVGRRLRACEEDLGVRLFDRTPDGLVPTAAGQELINLAEQTEAEVMATEGRILGKDLNLEGTLRVSTFDALYVPCHDAFASFLARYPSVEVTLATPSRTVSLNRREADVALRLTSSPPEGLVGRSVGELQFAAYASPALVERIGPDAEVGAYPWIGIDQQGEAAWHDAWLAEHGAKVVVRVDENSLVIRRLIQEGIGVYFLSIPEGEALGLTRVGEAPAGGSVPVWLLTLPDLRRNSRVRAFLDHMGEVLPPMFAAWR